jgi:carbonic anhydrase
MKFSITNNIASRFGTFSMVFLLLAATLMVSSCKKEEPVIEEPVDSCATTNSTGEWGYDEFGGPECWNSVCSHASCTGTKQSPIDIVGAVDNTTLPALQLNGSFTPTNIENNGHTIEFHMQPGTYMSYGTVPGGFSNELTLGQFHFHASSEHKVSGAQAGMEAHFVHRSIWENKYTVLSVLFTEGAENVFLKQFEANLPDTADETYEDANLSFNPYDLLPVNKTYFQYTGSLTTPPCSEVVTWIIFENKVEATAAQIALFSGILNENFRPIQELNGRTIDRVVL